MHAKRPVEIPKAGVFSDGTSVRLPGAECVRICSEFMDDMVLVSNDEICAAIKDMFEETRGVIEPAGALGIAGLKAYLAKHPALANKNMTYCCVCSGANMNFDRLRFVAERAKIGENNEVLLSVQIAEKPGAMQQLYKVVYPRIVTELSYRYSANGTAHVFIAFQVADRTESPGIVSEIALLGQGFEAIDITDNELAKSHIRFMAGGHAGATLPEHEVLYRLRFPALGSSMLLILEATGQWNLTLVHCKLHSFR